MEELDLEHELVQLLAHEAVRAAMETPLQEPILEAVEGSIDESAGTTDDAVEGSENEFEIDEGGEDERPAGEDDETEDETEADGKSAFAKATQGLLTFLVMFAVLYVVFRRLAGDD